MRTSRVSEFFLLYPEYFNVVLRGKKQKLTAWLFFFHFVPSGDPVKACAVQPGKGKTNEQKEKEA